MNAIAILIFVVGVLAGNAFRLLYYCASGRDISLLKPEFEIDRLRKEANRIESENTGRTGHGARAAGDGHGAAIGCAGEGTR